MRLSKRFQYCLIFVDQPVRLVGFEERVVAEHQSALAIDLNPASRSRVRLMRRCKIAHQVSRATARPERAPLAIMPPISAGGACSGAGIEMVAMRACGDVDADEP